MSKGSSLEINKTKVNKAKVNKAEVNKTKVNIDGGDKEGAVNIEGKVDTEG